MQKAVVAYLHEARRKNMLQETTDELEGGKAQGFTGSTFRIGIAKKDLVLLDLENAGV